MNPPKVTDEDYINFIIATPRDVTATEAERVQPESTNAPAHAAFTRLLQRLEPDAETLWQESKTQIDFASGILVLDDSTLEKPFSKFNALVYQHWSGKQKAVVSGINLITLLWTDGARGVPIDYRLFDKDRDAKTKNDHFSEMLVTAFERGFHPKLVCFDSWYGSIDNLKLVRSFGWHFLTRLKANRQIRVAGGKLQAVSEAGLCGGDGTIVWLKGFGEIKVFRIFATNGTAEYWATSLKDLTETEREAQAKAA
jgi:putative transposase